MRVIKFISVVLLIGVFVYFYINPSPSKKIIVGGYETTIMDTNQESIESIIREKMEYAYFEGQKDALNGRIRVEKISDTSWIWIESPWDSGKPPILTNLIDND